jgi:hypothetical protein
MKGKRMVCAAKWPAIVAASFVEAAVVVAAVSDVADGGSGAFALPQNHRISFDAGPSRCWRPFSPQ